MESKEVVCNEQYCIKGEVMPFNLTLSGGMSFQEYMDKVQGLMGADKTTGQDHSEILLHYTKMNVKRMLRWDKTIELLPELQSFFSELELDLNFMVITEAWCGDAAPIVPLVNKIASTNPRFSMTAILRDDHPEIMERYLTNGAKSIPIVVVLLKMKDQ